MQSRLSGCFNEREKKREGKKKEEEQV